MGHVRAAGFHQSSLRNGTAQHGRIAQGERDVLFQGRGCPLGQTGRDEASVADYSSNGSASQYSGQQIGSFSRAEQSPGAEPGAFFVRRIVRSKSIFRDVEMEWENRGQTRNKVSFIEESFLCFLLLITSPPLSCCFSRVIITKVQDFDIREMLDPKVRLGADREHAPSRPASPSRDNTSRRS